MVVITKELIRRKADHHDDLLSSLEELSLHQLNIENIQLLSSVCPRLRILYLQNNAITRIEGLHKLREVEYLNLALNNIERVEGLQGCEKLNKLDLTINFISLRFLLPSLLSLQSNVHLRELYLSGNPCASFSLYRLLVILLLPSLHRLDGTEVNKTERLEAKQREEEIKKEYEKAVEEEEKKEKEAEEKGENKNQWNPEARRAAQREMEAKEREKEEEKKRNEEKEKKNNNEWKAAQDKLSEKVVDWETSSSSSSSSRLPSQRNTGKYEFSLVDKGEEEGTIELCVSLPRHLDSSFIDVDVHSEWIQILIHKKNLLLHLPREIVMEKSKVQRISNTGQLKVVMRTVQWEREREAGKGKKKKERREGQEEEEEEQEETEEGNRKNRGKKEEKENGEDQEEGEEEEEEEEEEEQDSRALYYKRLHAELNKEEGKGKKNEKEGKGKGKGTGGGFVNSVVNKENFRSIVRKEKKEKEEQEKEEEKWKVKEIGSKVNKELAEQREKQRKEEEEREKQKMKEKMEAMGLQDEDVPPLE